MNWIEEDFVGNEQLCLQHRQADRWAWGQTGAGRQIPGPELQSKAKIAASQVLQGRENQTMDYREAIQGDLSTIETLKRTHHEQGKASRTQPG